MGRRVEATGRRGSEGRYRLAGLRRRVGGSVFGGSVAEGRKAGGSVWVGQVRHF